MPPTRFQRLAPDSMPRLPDLWRSSHREKPNAAGWQQRSAPLQQRPAAKDEEGPGGYKESGYVSRQICSPASAEPCSGALTQKPPVVGESSQNSISLPNLPIFLARLSLHASP